MKSIKTGSSYADLYRTETRYVTDQQKVKGLTIVFYTVTSEGDEEHEQHACDVRAFMRWADHEVKPAREV